jgi:hypothetical protein
MIKWNGTLYRRKAYAQPFPCNVIYFPFPVYFLPQASNVRMEVRSAATWINSLVNLTRYRFDSRTTSRQALEPIQPPTQWVLGVLPLAIKRQANQSPPSITEATNTWTYTWIRPYVFMTWGLTKHGQLYLIPCRRGSHIFYTIDSQMAVRSALRAGRPPFTPAGRFLVLISVRSWVDPKPTVWLEGLDQLKNPMTSSAIEPATFRLVA